jgi:hypothetical protein
MCLLALARILAKFAVKFLLLHLFAHVADVEKHLPLPGVIDLLLAPVRRL